MEKKKNVFEVSIKFNEKEFNEAIDKAFEKKKKDIKLDGFREGKVPKDVYYKKAGKQPLYMDAVDILLPEAYDRAIKEGNYQPIIEPKVDLKYLNEDGVEFSFVITTMPEVEIKKYTGLKVKKAKVEVTEEEINHEIEGMLARYSELVVKEFGEVEEGNIAVIDFEGFKDGVAFEGGKGENYSLEIGSNTFIPGFEEQLVGMKSGEEKDINVTFPEDYHAEDLKGKPVVFKVKVNEVKEVKIPELDKDFFEDLGFEGVDTKEKLEAEIEKNIIAHKEADAENKYIDAVLEAAAENCEVDIPEAMISEELDRMVKQYEEHLKMQGLTLEQLYQFTNSNEEALREQMKEEANKRVKFRLMLEEIAKAEKIEISDEEAKKEATKLAEQYQIKEEEFLNMFGGLEMVKYDGKMRKAIEILKGE